MLISGDAPRALNQPESALVPRRCLSRGQRSRGGSEVRASRGQVEQVRQAYNSLHHAKHCLATSLSARAGWGTNPRFTFVTVITLAEGIGANTAIFPVSNALSSALRRRPFFYHNPEQLVRVIGEDETEDETKDHGSNYSVPSGCAMRTSLSPRWPFGRTTT